MQRKFLVLPLFLGAASTANGLSFDTEEAKKRPVTKVVDLLKGVSAQLDKEAEGDAKSYETYKCWCKKNGDEKAKAAAEAGARIKRMKARIVELKATSARLEVEIKNLGKDVKKYEEAMDKAMAIRKKTMEKFTAAETEALENLDAVNSALGTVQAGSSLVQLSQGPVMDKLNKVLALNSNLLSGAQYKTMSAFLQQQSPGNDAVTGVLTGLKSDFDENLRSLRAEEAKDQENYAALIKAKRSESDAAKASMDNKKEEKADADEEMMHKRQDIKDTQENAGADAEFAAEVKEKCYNFDKEYEQRTKTRADEMEAVAKATEALSNDDAKDLFATSVPTSFLQTSKSNIQAQRERIFQTLFVAGKQSSDNRLVTLAMKTKLDSFTRVQESIDEMVAALTKEQADEVKHKDYCVEEFQQNKLATEDKTRSQKKQNSKVESLKLAIKQGADEIVALQADISESQTQLKVASQNREAENADFQVIVKEQRDTQVLLKKALTILSEFYSKQAALVQTQTQANPEEPATFKDYKKSGTSMGVMTMLQDLINDAAAMELEAEEAEKTAQKNYETFAKETSASVASKSSTIADKSGDKAKNEKDLVETKEALSGTTGELMELSTVNSDLHQTCDFVMLNFDVRQKARNQEVDALKQAKSYLNGAKL
eukprot:TRINITY_DN2524_c0_g1_i1.p1 TRINITY_DN2524_c0_g1~~TRINITY_DN2524_c0_g1_i1.p1  ORF type:complete len:657 (-),score=219.88 TRINITY_DN2524_c0_g1_i1:220-2190(-)